MAKTNFIQSSFISGVLSPLIRGRIDLAQYYQGAQEAKNFVLLPQGGIKRRAGTEFLEKALPVLARNTTACTMPQGGTGANISDAVDGTTTVTTTNISTVNPYVVAKLDLGAATYIEVADVRGIFLTTGSSTEFVVQYSDDDITYTTSATIPTIGTASQDFRVKLASSHRYWQLARVGATDLGTDKVTLSDFNLWELSATASEAKLKDFSVESDRHYLLSLTDGNMRIFRTPNTYVADVKVSYTSAQVEAVRDTQSEQVMLLFHEDVAPQRIVNLGTDTGWVLDAAPFTNVPQFDYNDSSSPTPTNDVQVLVFTLFVAGDTFQLDIEGILSKNITFAGDANAAEQSATAFNIEKNIQDMPVMGETGVSVARTGVLTYTITVSGESTKAFELYSGFPTTGTATKSLAFTHSATGVPRKEDVWSSTRGYPINSCFYEGRLVLGGTKSKKQSLFLSKAGSAFDFEIDEGDPDDAIFTTISSRKLNNIVDVFPGRNLQIFTSGSEFTVNVSPVTPESITITPQTSHGALNLEAKEIDGATIFADRNGKTIHQYLYSFNEDAYTTNDVSVLSPELIKSPVDIGILGGTSSDDANWVVIVNNDGTVTVLNTLRSQDINGFTEWVGGFITNVAVADEELYFINKRTIGGVESKFIERWSFDFLMDNAVLKTAAATVTGLDYLEGETVQISADGSTLDDRIVSGGSITLTTEEQAHTNLEIGINFIPSLKLMPLSTNIGSGQNQLRIKKITRMNIQVLESYGIYVENLPVPIKQFGSDALDAAPIPKTGIIEDVSSVIGWTRQDMPLLTVPNPTPCTILSWSYEVESS